MSQTIDTTPEGLQDAIQAVVEDIAQDCEDANYQSLLDDWRFFLEDLHQGYFAAEKDPQGKAWARLNPEYALWKKIHGIGDGKTKKLQLKGPLKASLTGQGGDDAIADYIANPPWWGLTWGTSVPYAIFHQEGVPKKNLPKRQMVGLTADAEEQIVEMAADAMKAEVLRLAAEKAK